MTVCFVVLVHTGPSQVGRLVDHLAVDGDSVVVHVDERVDVRPFMGAWTATRQVSFVEKRQRCAWANYSLVEASLRGLELALERYDFTHVCLISGQDYPITSSAVRRSYFDSNQDRSYLFWSVGDPGPPPDRHGNGQWQWDGDRERTDRRHFWVGGKVRARLPNRYTPFLRTRRPPAAYRIVQGSSWWNLTRAAAVFCLGEMRSRPDLVRFFRRALAPDENVFQMLLLHSDLRELLVNEDLRWLSWSGIHPRWVEVDDLPEVLGSKKLFARKFDMDRDPGLLDVLDQHIGSPGPDVGGAPVLDHGLSP